MPVIIRTVGLCREESSDVCALMRKSRRRRELNQNLICSGIFFVRNDIRTCNFAFKNHPAAKCARLKFSFQTTQTPAILSDRYFAAHFMMSRRLAQGNYGGIGADGKRPPGVLRAKKKPCSCEQGLSEILRSSAELPIIYGQSVCGDAELGTERL